MAGRGCRLARDLVCTQVPVGDLRTYHRNPRRGNVDVIADSLRVNGQYRALAVNKGTHTGRPLEVLAGNHTLMAARTLGWHTVAVTFVDVDDDQAARIVAADNRTADLGDYDGAVLGALLTELPGLDGTGFADEDLAALLAGTEGEANGGAEEARRTLAERFGVPPFTVLDARQGYWQTRKRGWIALGLRSEDGRSEHLLKGMADANASQARIRGLASTAWELGSTTAISIFDPVLCELLVRWYSVPGARVLDPFAGGSVRGVVSAYLGREYTGVDLRAEQVEANREQAEAILTGAPDGPAAVAPTAPLPRWITGDSRDLREHLADGELHDLMLTCPPYYDLEQYSDDPADLSRCADYPTFLTDYAACLGAATDRMRPDAFAAVVTGAVRDKRGYVLDLPADTTRIMEGLGWRLYQDAVLVTSTATTGLRTTRQFVTSRKLGRAHQLVAVYHRGDISAVRAWPPCEIGSSTDERVDVSP